MTKQEVISIAETVAEFDSDFVFDEPGSKNEAFYDDGTIHVRVDGTRVCFDVGQWEPGERARSKKIAKKVAKAFGFDSAAVERMSY